MVELIAVTGATGGLGGRVARRLAARGARQRLVVRDPGRAPDLGAEVAVAGYADPAALRSAFAGVDTLFFVSASEAADRVAQHLAVVDAAADAGVGRVVYTSFLSAAPDATFTLARHHWLTEEHLRARGLPHTILRDNLYLDVFPYFVGADGVIRGPAGDGRVGAVARDDIADAAVAVLIDGADHIGHTYDVTGPEAISLAEIAAELTRASGRPVRYHAETLDEARASRARYGAPDWEVEGWVTSYAAVATGELSPVTDAVQRLAGHRPMSFTRFLESNPDAVARVRNA
jgi:NAD(P)H dehydrogenase (quinone)